MPETVTVSVSVLSAATRVTAKSAAILVAAARPTAISVVLFIVGPPQLDTTQAYLTVRARDLLAPRHSMSSGFSSVAPRNGRRMAAGYGPSGPRLSPGL